MDIDLTGRTALVTGAASAIGSAIAEAFSSAGATVVINDRDPDETRATLDRLTEADGQVQMTGVAADIATAAGIIALVDAVSRPDVLVNSIMMSCQPARAFRSTVLSTLSLARLYLPGMMRRNWGRLVSVTGGSMPGGPAAVQHVELARAGQLAVAANLARLVADTDVTVNCVLADARAPSDTPVKPEKVAKTVLYAVSEYASAANGSILRVNGADTLCLFP
jgi:NAD(P)-dependent dehydrogenase (short-subunit alcohol dehydrogenase family)